MEILNVRNMVVTQMFQVVGVALHLDIWGHDFKILDRDLKSVR